MRGEKPEKESQKATDDDAARRRQTTRGKEKVKEGKETLGENGLVRRGIDVDE